MAAAVVPLIVSAAPLLAPLAKWLVHGVEHIFGGKTGPTKLDTVVDTLLTVAGKMSTAGLIPGQLTKDTLIPFVEAVVQQLNSSGVLNPASSAQILNQAGAIPLLSLQLSGTASPR